MLLTKPYNKTIKTNQTTNYPFKNAKKIAMLFLLLFFGVLLTGCANITYSRVIHPNGAVEDKVIVVLKTEKLQSANISVQDLAADIEEDLNKLYFANIRLYTSHLEFIATPESLLEKQQIAFGIEPTNNVENIVATIQFKNRKAFNNYNEWLKLMQEQQNPPAENENEKETNENANMQTTKSFFYTVHTQTTNSVFTEELFSNSNPIKQKYSSKYSTTELDYKNLQFSQIYGDPNTKLKSNADYVATLNGIKLHEWNISLPLSDNNTMQFYTFVPNTSNWYITALAISLAVGIVVMLAGMVRKNINQLENNVFRDL